MRLAESMNRFIPQITLIAVCAAFQVFAQTPSPNVRVTIRAVEIFSTYGESNENERYRFRFWVNDTELPNNSGCLQVNGSPNQWYSTSYTITSNRSISLEEDITLDVNAWEDDDCKDNCRYNDTSFGCDDAANCGKTSGVITSIPSGSFISSGSASFRLGYLRPGNVSTNIITISYCNGRYRVKYLVTYTIPRPIAPTVQAYNDAGTAIPPATAYQLCSNNNIDLSTLSAIDTRFNGQVTYEWFFNINGETRIVYDPNPAYCGGSPVCDGGGPDGPYLPTFEKIAAGGNVTVMAELPPGGEPPPCCYEDPYIPRTETLLTKIPGSNSPSPAPGIFSFNVRSLKTSKWNLATISQTAVVNFVVRVSANGSTSEYSLSSLTLNVAPLPPVFGSDPTITRTCPNGSDGIIHLTGVSGINSYKYNLRPGFNNTTPCNPEKDNCFSGNHSAAVTGTSFNIGNVPQGQYTLWLVNFATQSGSCQATVNVEMLAVESLAITLDHKEDVICNGEAQGRIVLNKTGGRAPYTFTLTGQDNNDTGTFTSLPAGDYTATVTDGCLQSNSGITDIGVQINQPVKIFESVFNPKNANCVAPGNGAITSSVTKSAATYDKAIATPFTYVFRILDNGNEVASHESTSAEWNFNTLPPGTNYELIVTEKNGLACNGYKKAFSIGGPDPLAATVVLNEEVSCFGGKNGKVSFTATGGSDAYLFKMTKTAGDTVVTNDGIFTTLQAGLYTLVLQNGLAGCRDKITHPVAIDVDQPDRINAALTKTNISCFGEGDGKITATLSGGTPTYAAAWEELINNRWTGINKSGTVLDKREAGTFRLKITDSRTCVDSSSAVTIIEPALLEIRNVIVHDIQCLNEKGRIELGTSGGTGTHVFHYMKDATLPEVIFNGSTQLDAGNYVVRVSDENGCSDTDEGIYAITAPPEKLDFTYELSDFNGYNISCFGGSNGYAIVTATGGNGGIYSGYQFAKDSDPFQDELRVEDFNAGDHTLSVIDDRGCVVTKAVRFTQTDEAIELNLISKDDIACYGDTDGVLNLSAKGGLAPYLFRINESDLQSSGTFNGLASKTYHATVFDKNNCDASSDFRIEILNPPIEISANITDVSCFEGSDGSITIQIDGGVSPFQYAWTGQSNTTNILSDVETGSYKITVTDNAGCKRDSTFGVGQPLAALEASLSVVPVCFGRNFGVISINPSGGTAPYEYSVDNGQNYQSNAVFHSLGVGDYKIKVIDSKGCITTGAATIIQRNDQPYPDFIVASREHARDTLSVREISIPKPDSVQWIFDEQAIVTNTDPWSPEIVFESEGEYTITMIGYFQACDYAVTRTITMKPYDPDALPPSDPSYRPIESVQVSPNPNTGEFDVTVKLNKKYRLSLVIYDVLGGVRFNKSYDATQNVTEHVMLKDVASGVYMLRAITNTDARDVRIIINK